MMPKLIALARRRISAGMPSHRNTEHFRCGYRMDIGAVGKGLPKLRNIGHMGKHPEFDLAVVGRDQLVALLGDEGGPDLAALGRADRDVLQIGLGRRQAAGRGGGQRIGRVDPSGLGVDITRQRVGIGRFQLGELAPVDDLARQFVSLRREFLQDLGRGGPLAGLGLGAARKSHPAEQDVAELLGRADREALARRAGRSRLPASPRLAQARRKGGSMSAGRPKCRAAPSGPEPAPAAVRAAHRRTQGPLRPAAVSSPARAAG